jgi:hypothetical protein
MDGAVSLIDRKTRLDCAHPRQQDTISVPHLWRESSFSTSESWGVRGPQDLLTLPVATRSCRRFAVVLMQWMNWDSSRPDLHQVRSLLHSFRVIVFASGMSLELLLAPCRRFLISLRPAMNDMTVPYTSLVDFHFAFSFPCFYDCYDYSKGRTWSRLPSSEVGMQVMPPLRFAS